MTTLLRTEYKNVPFKQDESVYDTPRQKISENPVYDIPRQPPENVIYDIPRQISENPVYNIPRETNASVNFFADPIYQITVKPFASRPLPPLPNESSLLADFESIYQELNFTAPVKSAPLAHADEKVGKMIQLFEKLHRILGSDSKELIL